MKRSVNPVPSDDIKGMTVFNTEEVDTKKQPMFFGKPLGVQRYDSYKYPVFDKLTTMQLGYFWRPEEVSLQKDREELIAFYDFPAKHWQSLRTGNPIESTFGTLRHRTRRTKGCLNREGILHMMFKLGQCAEKKWRKLRGFDYLANVIEGKQFKDGIEVIPENRIVA